MVKISTYKKRFLLPTLGTAALALVVASGLAWGEEPREAHPPAHPPPPAAPAPHAAPATAAPAPHHALPPAGAPAQPNPAAQAPREAPHGAAPQAPGGFHPEQGHPEQGRPEQGRPEPGHAPGGFSRPGDVHFPTGPGHEFHGGRRPDHWDHPHHREIDPYWVHGYWNEGWFAGLYGWWWVVDGQRFLYDEPIYPYPGVISEMVIDEPPVEVQPPQNVWYYCDNPPGYYPYVQACTVPFRPVPAQ